MPVFSSHSLRYEDLKLGRLIRAAREEQGLTLEELQLQYSYHHEEEFAFALRGRLEFRIKTPEGEFREELGRGDCVYFRSDLPHAFRSLDADAAESLHIFCSSSASTDNSAESA